MVATSISAHPAYRGCQPFYNFDSGEATCLLRGKWSANHLRDDSTRGQHITLLHTPCEWSVCKRFRMSHAHHEHNQRAFYSDPLSIFTPSAHPPPLRAAHAGRLITCRAHRDHTRLSLAHHIYPPIQILSSPTMPASPCTVCPVYAY